MLDQLLGNWGLASVVSVVALLVSVLTVQLTYLVRSKERGERERLLAREEQRIEMVRHLELEQQKGMAQLQADRHAIENQILKRQFEMLKSELVRLSKDEEFAHRLSTARSILAMIEESLKTLQGV